MVQDQMHDQLELKLDWKKFMIGRNWLNKVIIDYSIVVVGGQST